MIYLVLAIASSAAISILMRLSGKYIQNNMAMFMANYGACLCLARIFMGRAPLFTNESGIWIAVLLGLGSGLLYLAGFFLLQQNMQKNGVVLSATFMKLGVLVPTILAMLVFHEQPTLVQLLGIGIAVAAIILIHFEKEGLSQGSKKGWLILLLLLSGFSDSMANLYDKTGVPALKEHYLFYTFLAALLLSLALAFGKKKRITGADLLFGLLIGIPNYFSARFLLLALGQIPAVVTYPVYSVATIVLISLAGFLAFHEKLSRQKILALLLILLSLVLLNV